MKFKENTYAQKLVLFMTGKLLSPIEDKGPLDPKAKKETKYHVDCTWMQALCYKLLVASKSTDILVEIISSFARDVYE
jgi:hypothetical protein